MITWRPDTCDCYFEVIDQNNFNCRVITKCPAHQSFADNVVFEQVHKQENQPKNRLAGIIREVLNITDSDDVRDGVLQFDFDQDRKINFRIKDLKPAQRLAIISRLAASPDRAILKDLLTRN